MLKIGLTGGIGSGKSTVAHIFKCMGIPVFDADAATKKMMEVDATIKSKIIAAFGEQAYTIEGKLNRPFIANIVFKDAEQLEVLNAITHPAAINAVNIWMAQQQSAYVVKEAALLFEAGTAGNLDFIIGIKAPESLRIARVMKRDNVGRQEVLYRMSKQISQEIKMRLCDFVIVNDEQQLLTTQVLALHEQLLLKLS